MAGLGLEMSKGICGMKIAGFFGQFDYPKQRFEKSLSDVQKQVKGGQW